MVGPQGPPKFQGKELSKTIWLSSASDLFIKKINILLSHMILLGNCDQKKYICVPLVSPKGLIYAPKPVKNDVKSP